MSGGLIVPNDLVGWWCPSIDATGGILLDRSGRNNHGTLTNMDPASDWVASGGKLALDFDGSDDFVNTGNWSNSLTRISVSAWVRPTSGTRQDFVSKWGSINYQYVLLQGVTASRFQFYISTTSSNAIGSGDSTTVISAGVWYHVVGTYDGSTVRLFINGLLENSTSHSGNLSASTQNNLIGKSGDALFAGQLDDIRIYNRALTAGEVSQLWQIGRGNMPLRRRRRYTQQAAGFKAYWARRQSQLIGGGV
jgi:hypothetical protein